MTILHLLVRSFSSSCYIADNTILTNLLNETIDSSPELLQAKMKIGNARSMTPIEMTIRTSYDETLIDLMLTKTRDILGKLSFEDKNRL